MKKLVLSIYFRGKLDRLSKKVRELSYLGEDLASFDSRPVVAIVGTRKPTPYGKSVTEELAEGLARAGVVVISGNAFGVDALAQKAAFEAGGKVIVVVPSGLDNIYPATNRSLALKIAEQGGTVLTEYESSHRPAAYDFLERNRIIAALSDLVIIPEAAERSGSLNTAKHAEELGIPVGALPGQITSTMSSGTHKLLKDGAHVIRGVDDVLELLRIDKSQQQTSLVGDNDEQTAILEAVGAGVVDPHQIQNNTGLSPVDFQTAVTMLEVQGKVTANDQGTLRLN